MNPEQEQRVRYYLAAGDKAEPGEWRYNNMQSKPKMLGWLHDTDGIFAEAAANARDAIKALLAERDAMREALEMARAKIVTGGAGGWAKTLAAVNAALAKEPKCKTT